MDTPVLPNHLRLLLVDDHTLVRSGLRALLEEIPGIEVVGEAANGREVLERIGQLNPHLVLMDIAMPELNGIAAAERIRKNHPHIKIMMLSMHSEGDYVRQALSLGVNAYVLKDAGALEFELAIDAVRKGTMYLSPAVASHLVQGDIGLQGLASSASILTSRQIEVLQLIAEGATTKEIAAKLQLNVKTVESHRANLMERLNIHDIAGLVRFALKNKVIGPD